MNRIILNAQRPDGDGPAYFDVEETFEECRDKVFPVSTPGPNEGHQLNFTFNKSDGSGMVLIHPMNIICIEENPED